MVDLLADAAFSHTKLILNRSCGYSTLDRRLRLRIAALSIRSPSTRKAAAHTVTDPCLRLMVLAQTRCRQAHPRCTLLPNSTASKRRLQCQVILVVVPAQKTAARPRLGLATRLPATLLGTTAVRTKSRRQQNTRTRQKRYIPTMPILKMPTKLVSANMKSWKCRMSAADGGRPENPTERPVLLHRITLFCCDSVGVHFSPFLVLLVIPTFVAILSQKLSYLIPFE